MLQKYFCKTPAVELDDSVDCKTLNRGEDMSNGGVLAPVHKQNGGMERKPSQQVIHIQASFNYMVDDIK